MQGLKIRRSRLVLPRQVIPFEEWLELGREHLAPALNQLLWVLGDWLFYAHGEYGRREREGYELLGLDAAFLAEVRDVAAACPDDLERDPTIPWGRYLLALGRHGHRRSTIRADVGEIASESIERCGGCRRPLYSLTKHERKYCSNACRQRAYRMRRAQSAEFPLAGGAMAEGVVRVGETVRKPPHRNSRLVREVLQRLERVGFDAAPRWLGVDEQGRDMLSWIEGETFTERGRMHPYIGDPPDRIEFSDEQLGAVMRLLRRYHDTFTGEVFCHGDFGPWNIVWRDGMPIAVIDFDNAHAGEAADDVAYALRMFVGYGFAPGEPSELARRTRLALSAYGAPFDVPAILEREYDLAEERCRRNGWHRALAKLPTERAWLEANRALFGAGGEAHWTGPLA